MGQDCLSRFLGIYISSTESRHCKKPTKPYPKFSLLWRRCFVEFFCCYEQIYELKGWHSKMKLAKILTQKLYNKVVLTYGWRNARWYQKCWCPNDWTHEGGTVRWGQVGATPMINFFGGQSFRAIYNMYIYCPGLWIKGEWWSCREKFLIFKLLGWISGKLRGGIVDWPWNNK